ncbi:hypothetical protein P3F56_04530 [cyanobacterium endosymbiont of Epithemia clementina EcSB]|nr:hypothetical protein [cyanobacterium endosymbiont of Epithemia clementina EcSB]WGT68323.1 hypothetical protein P3F56_04530 [cyanobacterium endosymbiont of Epithemia clementina EcSB]
MGDDTIQGLTGQSFLAGGFETDILEDNKDVDILIGGNVGASDDKQKKLTGGNSLDIFVLQIVADVEQFDTITDFEDGTDLFDSINFGAVTRIKQDKNDVDIVSGENTVARELNTNAVRITIADFVQPVV